MDDFLTDQQQAARVRGWVREYAPAAIVALVIGFGGYFGYTQWQARQERHSAEVSDLYEEFRDALENDGEESASELLGRMANDFEDSGYLDHARLLLAKAYVDSLRPSLAEEELKAVIETTGNGDLRQLARLRLARVYLYMERPEDGLATLEGEAGSPAWEQLIADMRGDLHHALGQVEEARTAYQAALDRPGQIDAGWIQTKLDYLNAASARQADAGAVALGDSGEAPGEDAKAPRAGKEDAQPADAAEPEEEASDDPPTASEDE